MKCSKCGLFGHKRNNKKCQLYDAGSESSELDDTQDDELVTDDLETSSDEEIVEETTVIVEDSEEIFTGSDDMNVAVSTANEEEFYDSTNLCSTS